LRPLLPLHSFPTRRSSDLNVSPELHSAGTGNPQPAIPQEARSEVDVVAPPIWQGGHPSESARGDVPPWHGMRAYWAKDGARMTVDRKSTRLNSSHRTISYA